MGADIDEKEDGLVIRPASLEGAELDSHHDHRMGLALSVAALKAKGESVVRGVSCFRKTFPHFKKQFALLGAKIEETK